MALSVQEMVPVYLVEPLPRSEQVLFDTWMLVGAAETGTTWVAVGTFVAVLVDANGVGVAISARPFTFPLTVAYFPHSQQVEPEPLPGILMIQ